jgi:hypothetical protein
MKETAMKTFLTFAGSVLLATTLTACSPGINEGIGHHITFDSSGMVVHAIGKPDAHIGSNGSLAIDGRPIDVTPAQRALLQRYYVEARGMMQSGEEVGKQGAAMAMHGIDAAIDSIFHHGSSSAEKRLDTQSNRIDAAASQLCSDVAAIGVTQSAIATQIPAFKPYVSGARTECKITQTTTYTAGRTITKTSRTYSVKESGDAEAATAHASSRQPGTSGNTDNPTSSEP